MILTCPQCDAKFNIKDGALGTEGRKVKCSKCDNRWHAMPDGDPAGAAPEAAPPPPPPPAPDTEPEAPSGEGVEIDSDDPFANLDDDTPGDAPQEGEAPAQAGQDGGAGGDPFAVESSENAAADEEMMQVEPQGMPPESRFEPPEPKRSISAIIGWIIFIAVIVVIVLGVTMFRKDLVTFYPPINKVFELIGIAPDTLGHGLKLPPAQSSPRREGNSIVITITGEIHNTTKDTLDVPALKGDLYNAKGEIIYTHYFKASQAKILPGEKIKYTTEVKDPPPRPVRMEITFTRDQPSK